MSFIITLTFQIFDISFHSGRSVLALSSGLNQLGFVCWSSGVLQSILLSGTKDVVTGPRGAEGNSGGGTDAGSKGSWVLLG